MREFRCFPNGPYTTNTYLVYETGTPFGFVIDPATAWQPLLDEIRHQGIELKYIFLTHGHSDHTGGIQFLRDAFPDVKVVASELELEVLSSRKMSFARGPVAVDVTVKDGETMDIGPMHLTFISTPGHTPGGMCVLLDDWLFCGDTLFFSSVGRTDLWGGNMEAEIKSIKEKLFVLPDKTKCFPGHGGATTIGFEKENNPYCSK